MMSIDTPQVLVGIAYKLVSAKGTLLGTITVPNEAADDLRDQQFYRFFVGPPFVWMPFDWVPFERATPEPLKAKVGVIIQSRFMRRLDAVELRNVSIEEMEETPGFSFSPSASYLRSLLD